MRRASTVFAQFICALTSAIPSLASAAEFDATRLGLAWAIPFAGLLLSIALLPLLTPHFWHRFYGWIAIAGTLAMLLPLTFQFGAAAAWDIVIHSLLLEYLPFIIVITTLYIIAGGIFVRGNLHGSPALNTGLLALGGTLASVMGTTGAAMLLIRSLIRANDNRRYRVHTIVFFIFIVANAGGGLTPLGDPPLFLGFLKGVSFFWTVQHMFLPVLLVVCSLLAVYFVIDTIYYRRDAALGFKRDPTPDDSHLGIEGKFNFLLLAAVIGAVLMSGLWRSGVSIEVLGNVIALESLLRDVCFLVVAAISLVVTPRAVRQANEFTWGPINEVAKLFFGIFLTMAPVLLMLKAGEAGAFAAVSRLVTDQAGLPIDAMYFWMTGVLSAFLDNAPTYLVFFNLAGGDPTQLMTTQARTLTAISAGAVFMGAMSYIGNAPNFMVKAIAEHSGIRMPSFFGFMGWSVVILLPLFLLMTWTFFL